MTYKGADVQGLRDLSSAMISSKADVERALAAAKTDLANLPWHGPDRDRYVADWNQHESLLRQICVGLERAAQDAVKHAQAQEQVSGGW